MIVVAIIAVLVAIAVPLFTGELKNARQTTFEANYRAAKAAAVTALLKDGTVDLSGSDKLLYKVKVDTKTGDISGIEKAGTSDTAKTETYEAWQTTGKTDSKQGYIIVEITKVDLSLPTT